MKKIIIIEDDPAILDALHLLFTLSGYIALTYADGNMVLQNTFERPDLFIIDKQLSGADGLSICKHLRQYDATAHVPVIILSATPHIQAQIKQAGANAFMEKPFSNKALLQLVSTLINGEYIEKIQ